MKIIEKPSKPRETKIELFYCVKLDDEKFGGYVSDDEKFLVLTNGEVIDKEIALSDDNSYIGLEANALINGLESGELSPIEQICLSGLLKYCKDNCNNSDVDKIYDNMFSDFYIPSRANCLYNTRICTNLKIKYFYNNLIFMNNTYMLNKLKKGKLSENEQIKLYEKLRNSIDKYNTFIFNFWQVECAVAKKYYTKEVSTRFLDFNVMTFIEPFKELHSAVFKDDKTQDKVFCIEPDMDNTYTRLDTTLLLPYIYVLVEDSTNHKLKLGKYFNEYFLTVHNEKYKLDAVKPWKTVSIFDILDEAIKTKTVWEDELEVLDNFFSHDYDYIDFLEIQGLPISREDFRDFMEVTQDTSETTADKLIKDLIDACNISLMKFKKRLVNYDDTDLCNYHIYLMLDEFAEISYYANGENWIDTIINEDSKIVENYLDRILNIWGISKEFITKEKATEITNFIFQISNSYNSDFSGLFKIGDIEMPLYQVCGGEPMNIRSLGVDLINGLPSYNGQPINGFKFIEVFK